MKSVLGHTYLYIYEDDKEIKWLIWLYSGLNFFERIFLCSFLAPSLGIVFLYLVVPRLIGLLKEKSFSRLFDNELSPHMIETYEEIIFILLLASFFALGFWYVLQWRELKRFFELRSTERKHEQLIDMFN